jgi:tetratricopeptide (TPR) repeat protein
VAKYNAEKSPADWVARANVLVEEVQKMGDELTAMVSEEKNVDGRLRAAYKQFGDAAQKAGHATVDAQRAALRAQALYQAYGGSDKALAMMSDFRKLGPNDGDGWIEMVMAEYVVNLGKATEGQYTQALKELESLHARDSTFLRTYPLAARIYLQKGDLDAAEAELDKLLVLTQKHDIASQLKNTIKVIRSEKAAKERELKELKEKNEKDAEKPSP